MAAVAAVVFIIINMNRIDYVATVKAHIPYKDFGCTWEDVVNKYLDEPIWQIRKEEDKHYVDIIGVVKDTEDELTISMETEEDPENSDKVIITSEAVEINGKTFYKGDDAEIFWQAIFRAYDDKCDDISDVLSQAKLMKVKSKDLDAEYANDEEGFSFRYPDTWEDNTKELGEDNTVVAVSCDLECPEEFRTAFLVNKLPSVSFSDMERIVYSDEEAFINMWGEDVKILETSIVEINGVSARKCDLVDQEGVFNRYYYYSTGYDMYRLNLICVESQKETFDSLFDAIVDSFEITIPEYDDSYTDEGDYYSDYDNYSYDYYLGYHYTYDDIAPYIDWEYWEPNDVYHWELSGRFVSIETGDDLEISIYSSRTTEREIGTFNLGDTWGGEVIPVGEGIYQLYFGEEINVILVCVGIDENGWGTVELFWEEEYIGEFVMTQQYMS